MHWIDNKYVGLLSNRLERFTRQRANANFRCPICGDSQKNKHKTRGYILDKPIGALFYCHNCHASMTLSNFLKIVDNDLAQQYQREKFLEKNTVPEVPQKPDITKIVVPNSLKNNSPLKLLKKISQLDPAHPAKRYVVSRKIPNPYHAKLFYVSKFKKWVNTFIPEKFEDLTNDEPRLIIPLLDEAGNFFGCQGRSFRKDGIRYITVISDDTKPKIFGLDTVNLRKKIYVVEGPIDSMFLENTVAMVGSDANLSTTFPEVDSSNITIVMDNEPRNKHIVKSIENNIDKGYGVCIWPPAIEQFKDVNDMILGGMTPQDVKTMIDGNTYSGLQAKAALAFWRKV